MALLNEIKDAVLLLQVDPIKGLIKKAKLTMAERIFEAISKKKQGDRVDKINVLEIQAKHLPGVGRYDPQSKRAEELLTDHFLEFFKELQAEGLKPELISDTTVGGWFFAIAIPYPDFS